MFVCCAVKGRRATRVRVQLRVRTVIISARKLSVDIQIEPRIQCKSLAVLACGILINGRSNDGRDVNGSMWLGVERQASSVLNDNDDNNDTPCEALVTCWTQTCRVSARVSNDGGDC